MRSTGFDNIWYNWESSKLTALIGFGSCSVLPAFHQFLPPVTDFRSHVERNCMVDLLFHTGNKPTEHRMIRFPIELCEASMTRLYRMVARLERTIPGLTFGGVWNKLGDPVKLPGRKALMDMAFVEGCLGEQAFSRSESLSEEAVHDLGGFLSMVMQVLEREELKKREEELKGEPSLPDKKRGEGAKVKCSDGPSTGSCSGRLQRKRKTGGPSDRPSKRARATFVSKRPQKRKGGEIPKHPLRKGRKY